MRLNRPGVCLALMLVICGCGRGRSEKASSEPAPVETGFVEMAKAKFSPTFEIGGKVKADGTIETPVREFGIGYPVLIWVQVKEAPKGLAVDLSVTSKVTKATVFQDHKEVPATKVVLFEIADTSRWVPGIYTAEIAVGGEVIGSPRFVIAELPPGSKLPPAIEKRKDSK